VRPAILTIHSPISLFLAVPSGDLEIGRCVAGEASAV
jgi:hypothetical protein